MAFVHLSIVVLYSLLIIVTCVGTSALTFVHLLIVVIYSLLIIATCVWEIYSKLDDCSTTGSILMVRRMTIMMIVAVGPVLVESSETKVYGAVLKKKR